IRDSKAPGGKREQTWHFPSRAECMVCHSRAANYVLGPSTAQMDKDHDYGGVIANQLRTLEHLGFFHQKSDTTRPPKPASVSERLVDPSDPRQSLEARARSYLHANCSSCRVEC